MNPLQPSDFTLSDVEIIDLRDPDAFTKEHIAGSLFLGLSASLSKWAPLIIPKDKPLVLVTDNPQVAIGMLTELGFDQILGYINDISGYPTESIQSLELQKVIESGSLIVDIRTKEEWERGHLEGSVHFPGEEICQGANPNIPNEKQVALMCRGGYRSVIALSVLRRRGFSHLLNVKYGLANFDQL
jgi:rhodanese-related sulfurtransferase